MLGNFTYYNPTRLHFGDRALERLPEELAACGPRVLLVYGGGSVKRSGLYGQVTELLRRCGKEVFELPGVLSNPTVDKLREGCRLARERDVDLILTAGGGSVCDLAKGVAASAWCSEDPWDKYYLRMEEVENRVIPVGCILTMAGTGSEMNSCSVITHPQQRKKIGRIFDSRVLPRFAILNPVYTLTVPREQMVSGIFDTFSHICEQYFSGEDDNTTDALAEGLMRSVVDNSRTALRNSGDYTARSNLMWAATWALNTLLAQGKTADWRLHGIGEAIGACTGAPHGMTVSAVAGAYYRTILKDGLAKFRRFAVRVWDIDPAGRSDEETAAAGLAAMEAWMDHLGVARSIRELGVTGAMLEEIADSAFLPEGGYGRLTRDDVLAILKMSM